MTIVNLSVFALAAVLIGRLRRGRQLTLLAASVFAMYWLQPPQQFVSLTYWIPTATIALTVVIWSLVASPEARAWRVNWPAALVIAAVALLFDLNRYLGSDNIYMTTTPQLWMFAAVAITLVTVVLLAFRFGRANNFLLAAALASIITLFILLKSPVLIENLFAFVSSVRRTAPARPSIILSWLGYSYVAFRLMHTIRDAQARRLPALTLGEFVNYVLFFPAFTAGPIDRAERFVRELREPLPLRDADWIDAGQRFFLGMFKKFVLADSLALVAINDVLVAQVHSAAWMWFFLYAYTLRIYFDFSGYTDIAIGLGRALGIRLPENFAAPYLKENLTQFWNAWHITLTQWFRSYFFNPLTRALRTRELPAWIILLLTQLSTMILIGLWHGIAWSFVSWGAWHGVGLFAHNRWTNLMQQRGKEDPARTRGLIQRASGRFLTFNFVALGWLFFTLSTPSIAWLALKKLAGFG